VVEPVTGLAIFAGSWLAKNLARDWADGRKKEQASGLNAAALDNEHALAACTELQERARDSLGRIGVQRIEAMRRVLPSAAGAARIAEERKLIDASAFKKEGGWFGGRTEKSLLGLSASLIAIDLALPEDAPITATETLLSTLAAQGAYKAFETLPHHDVIDAASMTLAPGDFDSSVMAGVGLIDEGVNKVDDVLSTHSAANDAASLAQSLDVDAIDKISSQADMLMSNAAGAVGDGVTGAMAEVGGAMNVLGDFIGDFVGPAGWALSGWTLGGTLRTAKKMGDKRLEVRANTVQLKEKTEKAKRVVARGEQLEVLNAEAAYQAFKHAWIMKQIGKRKRRTQGWKDRDATRAKMLENSSRNFWLVMHAPLLGEHGDAAPDALPVI
jgi:hypothetical protein